MKSQIGAPFPKSFRCKYTRLKSGCLCCRHRRKKCSEERPICLACRKNHLVCTWPDQEVPAQSILRQTSRMAEGVATDSSRMTQSTAPIFKTPSSFLALQRAHERAPHSAVLYDFFVRNTSGVLVPRPVDQNAFARQIVLLSCFDDVMAHCILALGGVHLNWNNEASPEIKASISAHSAYILSGLRHDVELLQSVDSEPCFEMAFKIVAVCHIEALSGSRTGTIFTHLRAIRRVILVARKRWTCLATGSGHLGFLEGLTMELYAYLVLVSMITPYGLSNARFMPLDSFVTSLAYLEYAETCGCIFGCGYDIFECIPCVAIFARARLDEGTRRDLCSPSSEARYSELRGRIDKLENVDFTIPGDAEQTAAAKDARALYCCALRIFLETAMCGEIVDDPTALHVIQDYVDEYVEKDAVVCATKWGAIGVWPCMIAGSCMTRKAQQEAFCYDLWNSPLWRVNQVLTAEKILKLLWETEDKRMFGPYGLHFVMEQYNIDMPMS